MLNKSNKDYSYFINNNTSYVAIYSCTNIVYLYAVFTGVVLILLTLEETDVVASYLSIGIDNRASSQKCLMYVAIAYRPQIRARESLD